MKKVMKHGILALSMTLAFTAAGTKVFGSPITEASDTDILTISQGEFTKQLESNPEANCLEVFASLYLKVLEKQHARELAMTEMRSVAAAQMQTAQLAMHPDSVTAATPAAPAAPAPQAAATPAPKPAATPAPKAAAKPAPAKTAVKAKTASSSAAKTVVTNTGKKLTYKKVLSIKATAYSASPNENGGWAGLDYMGNSLKLGTIAVDPKVIPLGSTVYITGYTAAGLPVKGMIGKATDIGGAIKGNRIDIFIPGSMSLVENFGIQNVQVYIL